jgi:WS/DGAT/MGAT family acyltransferase
VLTRRLSPLDAAFLYADTDEGPLNIGGISVFDGALSRDVLVARLRARLGEIPRYRQRCVPAPFGLGHPFWEDDPDFDVDRHVDEIHLPERADESDFKRATAAIYEGMLPRDRPLWKLYVVHGLEGGRSALVSKIHHAMVDGISGVELFDILFDLTPDGRTTPGRIVTVLPSPTSDAQRLAEAVWDAAAGLAEAGTRSLGTLARVAADPRATLNDLALPLAALVSAGRRQVSRLPFNRPLTGKRRLSWLAVSLAELRALRAATGATLNDIVLAIVGDGVGRYLHECGCPPEPESQSLRVMVPVDVRRQDEVGQLGNRVSIVPVEIPFAGPALARLATVAARTAEVKRTDLADFVERLASAGGLAPAALYAGALRLSVTPSVLNWSASWRDATPLTANLVCTNVPGPQVPMYAQGRLLVAHYPVVPLALEFGLSFAVLSYNQRMFVGAIADAAAVDDLESLVSQIDAAFVDLRSAAGVDQRPPLDVVRREARPGTGAQQSHAGPDPSSPSEASPPPAGRKRPARPQLRGQRAGARPRRAATRRNDDDV